MTSVLNNFPVASRLVGKPRSSLELVSHVLHVPLPSEYLSNIKNAMLLILKDELEIYSHKLGGVPVAYNEKSAKCMNSSGAMISAQSRVHFDLKCEFVVFKPKVKDLLSGVVNKITENTIGCLVHGCFYATIQPKAQDMKKISKLKIGDKITFRVTKLGEDGNGVLSIIGVLHNSKSKKPDCDENISKVEEQKGDISQSVDSGIENVSSHSNDFNKNVTEKLSKKTDFESILSPPAQKVIVHVESETQPGVKVPIEIVAEKDILSQSLLSETSENSLELNNAKKKKKSKKKKHKKDKVKNQSVDPADATTTLSESASENGKKKKKKKSKKAKKLKKEKKKQRKDNSNVTVSTTHVTESATIDSSTSIIQQSATVTEIPDNSPTFDSGIFEAKDSPSLTASTIAGLTLTLEQEEFIKSLGDIMQDKKITTTDGLSTQTWVTTVSSDKEIRNLNGMSSGTESNTKTGSTSKRKSESTNSEAVGSSQKKRKRKGQGGDESDSTKKSKKRKLLTGDEYLSPPEKQTILTSPSELSNLNITGNVSEVSEHQQQALYHLQKLGINLPLEMLSKLPQKSGTETDSSVFLSPKAENIGSKKNKTKQIESVSSFASPTETSTPMLPEDKIPTQAFSYQNGDSDKVKVKKNTKNKKKQQKLDGGSSQINAEKMGTYDNALVSMQQFDKETESLVPAIIKDKSKKHKKSKKKKHKMKKESKKSIKTEI